MSPREHLSLVVDQVENLGDEAAQPDLSLEEKLAASIVDAITKRLAAQDKKIAALYAQGKVRHVGYLQELESELSGFSTNGYTGQGSPNRADALVWAITALFPGIVADKQETNVNAVLRQLQSKRLGF